jgi:AraC family transcriptional regulator
MPELEPPRFETVPARRFAGLVERYDCQAPVGIPDQWQRFGPYIGRIPGQVGTAAYGVCFNSDSEGKFDYMSAVEINGDFSLFEAIKTLSVPASKYAVFTHRSHVAGIRATFAAIWNKWLPESGHKARSSPTLERYGPEFNPRTGLGGLEIWIAIQE